MAARRTLLVLAVVVAALAVLVASAVALFVVDYGTCSGDGGSPFSARDSAAGRFCDGALHVPWATALLAVPCLLLVALGIVGVTRSRVALLAIGIAAGVAAIVGLSAPVLALPDGCSGSDQRAYDRWAEGGRAGPRPADCDSY